MNHGKPHSIVVALGLPVLCLLLSSSRAWAEDVRAEVQKGVEALRGDLAAVERAVDEAHSAWSKAKRHGGKGRTEADREAHEMAIYRLDHALRKARRLRAVVAERGFDERLTGLESMLEHDRPVDETSLAEVHALRAALEDARRDTNELFALDDDGRTTLHGASEDEDTKLAERALAAGVNPDHPDGSGFIALHVAAWWGADEIVDRLLEAMRTVDRRAATTPKDGDPLGCSERPMQGATALHLACYTGRPGSVKSLLTAGADPNMRVRWRDTGTG